MRSECITSEVHPKRVRSRIGHAFVTGKQLADGDLVRRGQISDGLAFVSSSHVLIKQYIDILGQETH